MPPQESDRLLLLVREGFSVAPGSPLPLGASLLRGGINFAVYSRHATHVSLMLFAPEFAAPLLELPLTKRHHRTGDIWHIFVAGLDPGVQYAWRMDRSPNDAPQIHRFDPEAFLLDPYARDISGRESWAEGSFPKGADGKLRNDRRGLLVSGDFDWKLDCSPQTPLSQSVIYELHVRGFTIHPSSGGVHPGTFAGLAEKIPYLKELGITAVELLPVFEFEEGDNDRSDPVTGKRLLNYWGYHPIGFFAPKASYAMAPEMSGEVREFKQMVRAFHAAGIEVILDVVFNHTAEGDERGPVLSFRGIDNSTYYILDRASGAYHNYSGCGNTFNCNHPVVRDLVLEVLRYWVTEMHVDGFRFDLASILGRGEHGEVLANPPLIERIAGDPVLAGTKLIAEAWDAAGLYQVGTFPAWGRWAEWNGKFRDDVRRFVKGDAGFTRALALRLAGSPDLYEPGDREPMASINFVTCHDGFTLADLVSYNEKHNERNGESNRDGTNDNYSWNCGEEGATSNPDVLALRLRQQKNFLALLLCAQGVPMLCGGDEFGRTQQGNNNAYCQDNEISWMDWRLAEANAELLRFTRALVALRRACPLLAAHRFTEWGPPHARVMTGAADGAGPFVAWHGTRIAAPDWSGESRLLAMHAWGARTADILPASVDRNPDEGPTSSDRKGQRRQRDAGGTAGLPRVDAAGEASGVSVSSVLGSESSGGPATGGIEALAMDGCELYLIANAHWEAQMCQLPAVPGKQWHRVLDTSLAPPHDISDVRTAGILPASLSALPAAHYLAAPRSVVLLLAM